MEVDQLRIANAQRQLEAEATGIEAKAEALKKYNEAATFLELARLRIEAERDVHIDQAKAMGTALSGAQIRMYGNGEGTMDTIRGLFTQGFGIGEVLEGLAQSLPEGLRQRLSANGIQGLLGRPYNGSSLKQTYEHLNALVQEHLRPKRLGKSHSLKRSSSWRATPAKTRICGGRSRCSPSSITRARWTKCPLSSVDHDQRRGQIGGLTRSR